VVTGSDAEVFSAFLLDIIIICPVSMKP